MVERKHFEELYAQHINYLTGNCEEKDVAIMCGNFSNLKFENFNLDGLNISNADFTNCVFDTVNMRCCAFKDCKFDGCTFVNVDATCSIFDNSSFRYTTFRSQNKITGASFDNCSFDHSKASICAFDRSVFKNSWFCGSIFKKCSFDNTDLDNTSFDDINTTFDECSFPECSAKNIEGIQNINISNCIFKVNSNPMGVEGLAIINAHEYYRAKMNRFFKAIVGGNDGKRVAVRRIGE